jgi:hypothetical protein
VRECSLFAARRRDMTGVSRTDRERTTRALRRTCSRVGAPLDFVHDLAIVL